ncbi:MAG: iron ABC transporter permease [Oscillospiraceae bacterium]|jgi:iron complex transport system permease protein|nr:iron ABC transporter permease [Oscillospiraceae bacterium]
MHSLRQSFTIKFGALAAALIAAIFLGFSLGAVRLPAWDSPIFLQVRLPRVCACILCGAALAAAGLLSQTLLGNPLASPALLGVNAGAGLAIAGAGVLALAAKHLPLVAFAGAVVASLLIFCLSLRTKRSALLLAGAAILSMFSAAIDAVHTLFPAALPSYSAFMLGNFSSVSWRRITPSYLFVVAGIITAFLLCGQLDVFALGDETARSLGQRVHVVRAAALLAGAVLAGAAVSICGLLGFVGLMSPHLARMIFRTAKHSVLLPACLLLGAALVTFCDTMSRTLFAPYELPAGIALSLIGGPFFLYLLLHKRPAFSSEKSTFSEEKVAKRL